jgi:hypothetical protein
MSPLLRLALPALAAAGTAYAACSHSATSTIQNQGDASAIASCSTFSGSIAISTGTTDDIAIDGVKTIDGDLVASNNVDIKRISGSDLGEITGKLVLDGVQELASFSFPQLEAVDSVKLNALPNLNSLDMKVTKCAKIDIQNTFLQSLDGLNVEEAESIFIANNQQINEIAMQVGNVSESLALSFNNADVKVTFPNLIWANNLTFRSCGSIELPSLESLNDSLGIYESKLDTFSAPNLTHVDGFFAIVGNEDLSNMTFPLLEKVEKNLQIANNTNLHDVEFPKLKTVNGALDLSGNITKISTPTLNFVKGAFNLQSTGDIQGTCDDFYQPLKDDGKLAGKYTCRGKLDDPGTAESTPTSSSKPTGAASPLGVQNTYLGLTGLLAVFLL